ncbi:MAG: 23S rRNA (guanosine(2251)-2'-O)-methyltransferase RlmB [Candidatus Hydrogenedentes bacterium]|nr:23S rRNA (guanosine(2251)-2'-O)-methyltransferase RlmB [Candidatus Hydrogenedentota bacterium]
MTSRPTLVFGRNPVLACLRAKKRPVHQLFLLDSGKGLQDILDAAAGRPVKLVDRRTLDNMCGGANHQGAILEAGPLPKLSLEAWLDGQSPEGGLVVLLDSIEDPQNLGAIARSAAACGVQALVHPRDRSATFTPAAAKVAAGALEYLHVLEVTNLVRAIGALKDAGYWIAGLAAEGDRMLWQADFTLPTGLVVGNEGKGMRRLVRDKCDTLVRIPISGPITSLNASVSAAIALYECARQRDAAENR